MYCCCRYGRLVRRCRTLARTWFLTDSMVTTQESLPSDQSRARPIPPQCVGQVLRHHPHSRLSAEVLGSWRHGVQGRLRVGLGTRIGAGQPIRWRHVAGLFSKARSRQASTTQLLAAGTGEAQPFPDVVEVQQQVASRSRSRTSLGTMALQYRPCAASVGAISPWPEK